MAKVKFSDKCSDNKKREIIGLLEGGFIGVLDEAFGVDAGVCVAGKNNTYSLQQSNGQLSQRYYTDLRRIII